MTEGKTGRKERTVTRKSCSAATVIAPQRERLLLETL